jgi:uncharacterized protein YkwD
VAQTMVRSRTRIAAVLLICLPVVLSGVATDHARAGEAAQAREVMLQLTNDARERKGRDALVLDRQLSRYALQHSRAMAEDGALFHTDDLAALLDGVDWSMGGENVGVAPTLADLQSAFMGSRLHRRNILQSGYDHTAIGVVQSDGKLWVTVIFYG